MEALAAPIISETQGVKARNPPPPFDCRDFILELMEHVILTDDQRLSIALKGKEVPTQLPTIDEALNLLSIAR
jgi:hypothetical protein